MRHGRARGRGGIGPVCAAVVSVAAGCHIAGAKVWNLEQVHEADGTPKRTGRLRSDISHVVNSFLEQTNFGGADFNKEEEKKIEDPLGECLENLVELASCKDDRKVVALKAATYSWLAVDDTYALSRERSALELGRVAPKLGVEGPLDLGADAQPATPAEVAVAYDELVTATRECLRVGESASGELREACGKVRGLLLERQGALRLLRAANALLDVDRGQERLRPLRELRLELARRCVGLALHEVLADEHGLVCAAGLQACVRVSAQGRAELLRWALVEPLEGIQHREELALRALALLASYGVPSVPEGDPAGVEREWTEVLIRILRGELEWCQLLGGEAQGRVTVAACRALARITGRPPSLRAETWIAWWRASTDAGASAEESRP